MSRKSKKLGAGHASGMGRSGFKELAQAVPAFPAHSIQPVEEPGIAGNPTPQEIVEDKGAYEKMLNGYADRGQEQEQDSGVER